jgi:hypothetical protein
VLQIAVFGRKLEVVRLVSKDIIITWEQLYFLLKSKSMLLSKNIQWIAGSNQSVECFNKLFTVISLLSKHKSQHQSTQHAKT